MRIGYTGYKDCLGSGVEQEGVMFMSYQITFDGVASAELTHLLHAVQQQLNGRGMGLLGKMDAEAQPATSIGVPVKSKIPCSDSQPSHDPNCIRPLARDPNTYIGFVIGLIVGFGLTMLLRKKMKSPQETR
jgi:hypothetical protein